MLASRRQLHDQLIPVIAQVVGLPLADLDGLDLAVELGNLR